MGRARRTWVDWWNSEGPLEDAIWEKNAEFFVRSTDSILHYGADDVILDIGCGVGCLAALLKHRVKEIHCVDTSEHYLRRCEEKFRKDNSVSLYRLDRENYTDLSVLPSRQFSIITCLSVIQYYRNVDEVTKLMGEVGRVALPGARFLIADIPSGTIRLSEIYGLVRTAFEGRYILDVLKYALRRRTLAYQRMLMSPGILTFSHTQLNELVATLNLDAEVLSTQLTLNANRNHLLIRF